MAKEINLENQSLFVNAFSNASIGMALVSLEGDWLKVNRSFCKFFGYSEKELLNGNFRLIAHPDDVNQDLRFMEELRNGKMKSYQAEKRCVHKSGETIWCVLNMSIVEDDQGKPLYFICQIEDITVRKRVQYQLEKEKQQYQSLFEHHPDLVFSLSLDGKLISANASCEKITGYSPEELFDLSPLIVPEDIDRIRRLFYLTGQGRPQHYEMRIVHKRGNIVVLRVTNIPIIVDGQTTGIYCIAKDVTMFKEKSKEVREYQKLYQLISENVQDIITISNVEGIIYYVSPAIKTHLNYEPEELVGRHVNDLWQLDNVVFDPDYLRQSDRYTFECRARHKEGHYLWIETTSKVVRDEQGNVERILSVGRNITKRKNAEAELRKTKERLEAFFKNNADAIWMIDLNDKVIEVNSTFERMFGWKAEEVIGHTLPIIPESYAETNKKLFDRVKAGESMISIETRRLRRDGSTFYVSATLSPVRNADGKIIGVSGICRDITARMMVENEARTARAQLESFIDNHADAVIIYSKGGQVVRVNQSFEKMFGWRSDEIVNGHFSNLLYIPDHLNGELFQIIESVKNGEHITIGETERLNKRGEAIDVMITAFTMYDSSETFDGWAVILRDITEWKKSQELLQQSEKLSVAGQLAAGIAHEIRNPITSVKGFLQLMQTGYGRKEQYIEIMTSEIDRIELILGELLILAKPQVTRQEEANLKELLEHVVALLTTQGNLHNIEIQTEFELDNPYFECDENQMKQVFINFIKNSMEAMPNGGQIKIELKRIADTELRIRFIDQGCGISLDILEKIGQPFFTTKEKGTGLGFMISKKIIEDHGGSLSLTSQVGEGTKIDVRFPIKRRVHSFK